MTKCQYIKNTMGWNGYADPGAIGYTKDDIEFYYFFSFENPSGAQFCEEIYAKAIAAGIIPALGGNGGGGAGDGSGTGSGAGSSYPSQPPKTSAVPLLLLAGVSWVAFST